MQIVSEYYNVYRANAVMSLKDKEKCMQEIWQKERIFDDLLALILPGMV